MIASWFCVRALTIRSHLCDTNRDPQSIVKFESVTVWPLHPGRNRLAVTQHGDSTLVIQRLSRIRKQLRDSETRDTQ